MLMRPWYGVLLLASCLLVVCGDLDADEPKPQNEIVLTHSIVLDSASRFHLSWLPEESSITFRLEVATHGYVGLGFSPSGGMNGADIVVAWVTADGAVVLTDRYAIGNHAPFLDLSQDLDLHFGYENDTHTVVQFSRAWRTCDAEEDNELGPDTVRIIWAFHEDDPTGGPDSQVSYHSVLNRGTRSVHLAEPPRDTTPFKEKVVKQWDIRGDSLLLPHDDHTHYWCRIFRAPDLRSKHHMIALEPLIQPGNEPYVHHIVLYECHIPADLKDADGATSADWFEHHVDQPGEQCYSPNMPAEWSFCLATNAWAWAVGSEGERLPDHTGMPLGEEWGGATYFMLEIHYDNPAYHAPISDNSGIRIHYTDELRTFDSGMLLVGSEVNFLQFIPPRQPEFTTVGHCSAECTSAGIPDSGINIINGVLHAHLAGRKMRLRHVRNGVELPMILRDEHYDFNFQASRVPESETTVLPGDQLITECVYNTSTREAPTFGGLSTRDEMCLVFILYYPRAPIADCRSLPALTTLTNALGIDEVYGDSFGKLVEFMKDIGASEGNGGSAKANGDSLASLLTSLADETGHQVPTIPSRPSSAPLTEEEILAQPFYTVAEPEPVDGNAVAALGYNYRTLLIELLQKLRIKSPSSLHNKTVGHVFASMDWLERGPRINELVSRGEHNSLCLSHGRKPLTPYQPVKYPEFVTYPTPTRSCTRGTFAIELLNFLNNDFAQNEYYLPLKEKNKSSANCCSLSRCLTLLCLLLSLFHVL